MSRNYGLIIANISTDRLLKLSGDITALTVFNKIDNRRYLIGDDKSGSPLAFDIEIITDDGRGIPQDVRRTVEKWLFNRGRYSRPLYLISKS